MSTPLRDRLRARLTDARRARDTDVAGALRSAIAALENAEAVSGTPVGDAATSPHVAGAAAGLGAGEAARRVLGDAEERAIVEREIEELLTATEEYAAHGREPEAAAAARAAEVLREVAEEPSI